MSDDPVTVVFLGCMGRSGSTLLSRVLDRVPGFVSVGELCAIWDHGVLSNRPCGCGVNFADCEFWSKVGALAFGGWDQVDAREMETLRRRVERVRHFPLVSAPGLSRSFTAELRRYTDVVSRLYPAVREASGQRLVVNTSKNPSTAMLLHKLDGIDVRLVHLVRSPYGVTYSWAKDISRPDLQDGKMSRLPVRTSAARWMAFNGLLETLTPLGLRSTRIRYEDFVAAPRRELQRVLDFLGEIRSPDQLAFIDDSSVELGSHHSVWGNPMRLRVGREQLRLDEEWRRKLSAADQRTVTAITTPGLLRYGYRGIRRAEASR